MSEAGCRARVLFHEGHAEVGALHPLEHRHVDEEHAGGKRGDLDQAVHVLELAGERLREVLVQARALRVGGAHDGLLVRHEPLDRVHREGHVRVDEEELRAPKRWASATALLRFLCTTEPLLLASATGICFTPAT
jgi:hypothetical protein